MSMPDVISVEPVTTPNGDRHRIMLSNGMVVMVTTDDARKIASDESAARRFLATWSSPNGAK